MIAGAHASNEEVVRFVYAVRASAGALPVALYRRPRKEGHAKRGSVHTLPAEPLAAQQELMAVLRPAEAEHGERLAGGEAAGVRSA